MSRVLVFHFRKGMFISIPRKTTNCIDLEQAMGPLNAPFLFSAQRASIRCSSIQIGNFMDEQNCRITSGCYFL
jgi:hypothetical protein